jgi:hypothetical protein
MRKYIDEDDLHVLLNLQGCLYVDNLTSRYTCTMLCIHKLILHSIWNSYLDSGQEQNFYKLDNTRTFGLPYDFNSILHYEPTDFSKNGEPTIVSKVSLSLRSITRFPATQCLVY